MKKIDIMNNKDLVEPGEVCRWQLVGGKVKRIEETIPIALVVEKEEIKEVRKIVEEKAEEVEKEVPKKKKKKW